LFYVVCLAIGIAILHNILPEAYKKMDLTEFSMPHIMI